MIRVRRLDKLLWRRLNRILFGTLRKKLIILFLIMAIVPLSVTSYLEINALQNTIRNSFEETTHKEMKEVCNSQIDDNEKILNVYTDEETGWKFIAVIPKEEFSSKIRLLYLKILLVGIFVVLGVFLLAVYISERIAEPIIEATDFAQKISNNNLEIDDLKVRLRDEIGNLGRALNNMKNNLKGYLDEKRAAYQQLEAYAEEIDQLNDRLEYQARHDFLTELPNRRSFLDELDEELSNKNEGVVMLLDLDNFKEINDTLGHVYGDELLKKLGERLLELSREDIFVARYGGDEFLILLKNETGLAEIEEQIYKIKEALKEPFTIKNNQLQIDFSIGITLYPNDAYSPNQLITNADAAMYRAKENSKKDYFYYDIEIIEKIQERKEIKKILETALKTDGFLLKYQPQINLKTGQADYLEALIRLKDYDISPGKFIPIAEDSGLIIEIGRWVTEKVITKIAKDREVAPKTVSINFSVYQLDDRGYVDFLAETLQKHNVQAEAIEIEITESILIGKESAALDFLKRLKDLGIELALDDFGTGYSSLNYLNHIPLDKIKIDKSLNEKFLEEQGLAMENLIKLFHSFELPVVAEGIETKEQYQRLKKKKCDYIQGYLFSKPITWEKVEEIEDYNFIRQGIESNMK